MLISIVATIFLALLAAMKPRPELAPPASDAYEEPLHVVADADGTHVEPVGSSQLAVGSSQLAASFCQRPTINSQLPTESTDGDRS
jgi:hypothetical protein